MIDFVRVCVRVLLAPKLRMSVFALLAWRRRRRRRHNGEASKGLVSDKAPRVHRAAVLKVPEKEGVQEEEEVDRGATRGVG